MRQTEEEPGSWAGSVDPLAAEPLAAVVTNGGCGREEADGEGDSGGRLEGRPGNSQWEMALLTGD